MYIDAWVDNKNNSVKVIERNSLNERIILDYPCNWVYYHDDKNGQYRNAWNQPIKKIVCKTRKEMVSQVTKLNASGINTYESDINVLYKTLSENYMDTKVPELNTMFFDIEVEVDTKKGFAKPTDPWAPVTAITSYYTKTKSLHTWALVPNTVTEEEENRLLKKYSNLKLYHDEVSLLQDFLETLPDVDVLSGWNSTAYDIPYLVNRVRRIAKHLDTKWCDFDQTPIRKKYVKFKKTHFTYEFVGRTHLDYLELYQKHNGQQLHSYRLDFVAEHEIKENKIPYEGTLEQLYLEEFDKFLEYNRQDVILIVKIDENKKFIDLANVVAHNSCVLLKHTMGTVVMTEQSIVNQYNLMQMKVLDKKRSDKKFIDNDDEEVDLYDLLDNAPKNYWEDDEDDEDLGLVVGAYVADPKQGMHYHVGATDVSSLYPSLIRALNMSPETLFAQILPTLTEPWLHKRLKEVKKPSEAWDNVFAVLEYDEILKQSDIELTVELIQEKKIFTATAKEIYQWIFAENSGICLTANGTIFDKTRVGVIPQLLTKWYAERQYLQSQEKAVGKFMDGELTFELSKDLIAQLKKDIVYVNKIEKFNIGDLSKILESDYKTILKFFNELHLTFDENDKIVGKDIDYKYWKKYWNARQQAKKINLNALYGALLNEGLRFYDVRLGQSTTMSGRMVVKHMGAKTNEIITGEYDYLGKSIVAQDTDSIFFDSIISTNIYNKKTIKELFDICPIKWQVGDKEYSVDDRIKVLSYNPEKQQAEFMPINYIYRHKVTKKKWRIEDQFGNELIVTDDHSIMIERDNQLPEIKPRDIKEDDLIISVNEENKNDQK
jgi:DNA polymerase elongation subunit (family B)